MKQTVRSVVDVVRVQFEESKAVCLRMLAIESAASSDLCSSSVGSPGCLGVVLTEEWWAMKRNWEPEAPPAMIHGWPRGSHVKFEYRPKEMRWQTLAGRKSSKPLGNIKVDYESCLDCICLRFLFDCHALEQRVKGSICKLSFGSKRTNNLKS